MKISAPSIKTPSYKPAKPLSTSQPNSDTAAPADSVSFGMSRAGEAALAVGVMGTLATVGVGAPAALGMGAVKSFMNGNYLLGLGLGAASVGAASTVGVTSLGFAAMTTDGGSSAGLIAYGAFGALATAGAATLIF